MAKSKVIQPRKTKRVKKEKRVIKGKNPKSPYDVVTVASNEPVSNEPIAPTAA